MIEARNLSKSFDNKSDKILDHVSFSIRDKEVVSVIGKSGEGKSTIARILCGTIRPDAGAVLLHGEHLVCAEKRFNLEFRRNIQLIPQQPFAALDPRQRVGDAIAEPLLYYGKVKNKREAKRKVEELLEKVWLEPEIYNRYPSQISGGQAQRIMIARSISVSPKLLIADEATSMLDISSQALVIKIFRDLVEKEGISILFISHDQPLVDLFSQRTYILSSGNLKEIS